MSLRKSIHGTIDIWLRFPTDNSPPFTCAYTYLNSEMMYVIIIIYALYFTRHPTLWKLRHYMRDITDAISLLLPESKKKHDSHIIIVLRVI